MANRTSLRELLSHPELRSILEDLLTLFVNPIIIEDPERYVLLEKGAITPSTEEYEIIVNQAAIGFVRGDREAQIIARLLSYLAHQETLVFFDDLTQIPNRRYFNRYFQQEWRRCQREFLPLSLLFCDLDYFKAYNDYYGHQSGDFCLAQVARLLQEALKRPGDTVFRYGGEEFALLLPNTTSEGGQIIAEQIIQRMHQAQIPHYPSPVSSYVTVSLGIAVVVPSNDISSESFFQTADIALYRAKATGRNRYCLQKMSENI